MTRIRFFLFSDPPSLAFMPIFPAPPPACASSLPDSLCFDSCFTIAIGEKYVYVGCIKNYI